MESIIIPHPKNSNVAFRIGGYECDTLDQTRHYTNKYIHNCGMFTTYGDGLTAHSPTYEIPNMEYGIFCEAVCKFIHSKNSIHIANLICDKFMVKYIDYSNWEKMLRYLESYKNGGKIPYFNKNMNTVSTSEKYVNDNRWECGKYLNDSIYSFTHFFGISNDMFLIFNLVDQYKGNALDKNKFLNEVFNIPIDTPEFNHLLTWANRLNILVKSFKPVDIMFSRLDFTG